MKSEVFEQIVNNMPKYSEFLHWFEFDASKGCWNAVQEDLEGTIVLETSVTVEGEQHFTSSLEDEFLMFKKRPEYAVTDKVDVAETSIADQKYAYINKLVGCLLMRFRRQVNSEHPDAFLLKIQRCIEWLEDTDFFSCPASTQYHESVPGGLLHHSLNVSNRILDIMKLDAFHSVQLDSAILLALCHDWCKIGAYEMYYRNVKNEQGKWEQVPSYRRNLKGVPLGHGVSSMFLLSRFVTLSVGESLAIRWHMGAWNVAPNEMDELQAANEKEPLVHLLQFADMLSITEYANS